MAQACREMWKPLATVSLVMAVAYITNYSSGPSTIGLAQTGSVFPLLSPVIGLMGVFITGSVVNNNTLFAHLQAVTDCLRPIAALHEWQLWVGSSPFLTYAFIGCERSRCRRWRCRRF